MDEKVMENLLEKVKSQVSQLNSEHEAKMKPLFKDILKQKGYATEEQYKAHEAALKEHSDKVMAIIEKQGVTIQDMQDAFKRQNTPSVIKSIPEVLEESKKELEQYYLNGVGSKRFMLNFTHKGEPVLMPMSGNETIKDTGPTGTIANIVNNGVASVTSSLNTAAQIRLGGDAPIVDQYRNSDWIFGLLNVSTADFSVDMARYWDEVGYEGAGRPAQVAEGATKPLVQYKYVLKAVPYKKTAQLITFTEEFNLDFRKLHDDIMVKGRRDLMNKINTDVVTNVMGAATLYNPGVNPANPPFTTLAPNGWDVMAAMAAMVDSSTFGNNANTAVMHTNDYYGLGTIKSPTTGAYYNRPSILDNVHVVQNPGMTSANMLVGDLKQYNLMLRGGFIVRIGYNGTDFAENKFSVVMEQYYFDWISDVRKTALWKGVIATVAGDIDGGDLCGCDKV